MITRSTGQDPSGGVCPAGGYSGSTVVTSPDAAAAGKCYVYTLTGTDNVGNTASVTSNPILVDQSLPVFQSASVNGTTLTMTYDKTLGSPAPTAVLFTVTYDGVAQLVSSPSVSGHTVQLTVPAPNNSEDVTVAYAVPTLGENPIQDLAGNQAAALPATAVTNATADTVAPGVALTAPATSGYSNANSIGVQFHATRSSSSLTTENGDSFECALNGGAYSSCASPDTVDVSSLADGPYTLHVKASDAGANTSAPVDSPTITIDRTAPAGGAISVPARTNSTTITIASTAYTGRRLGDREQRDHPLGGPGSDRKHLPRRRLHGRDGRR